MSKVVKLTQKTSLILPAAITGRTEVSRLLAEIEAVDYDFESQAIRTPGVPIQVPPISRRLSKLCEANSLSVEDAAGRKALLLQLREIKEKAPVLHITFANEPEPTILTQLIDWVRVNLHPLALVTVGLQPGLVGGCVVRTPDHIYDFSFRNQLQSAQSLLHEKLGTL